jgi:archaeal flagellar protein FlaJ
MSFSKSSPKRTIKGLFEEFSAFDLFYQITYMSATSAAGLPRRKVFELGARIPSSVAQYFVKINELVVNLQYDYPAACRMVGGNAPYEEIRSFLLRLADALESGEPLASFLAREAGVQGDQYTNKYDRDVESLKKWTDAYSSLIMSEALLVIINLVSTMIYRMSAGLMLGLLGVAVLVSVFGAYVLSRSAPREVMAVRAPAGSPEQRHIRKLFRYVGPGALLVAALLASVGVSWEVILLLCSGVLIPIGLMASASDKKLAAKEGEISSFLRSLGGMATSTGTTLTEALGRMELSSFPHLKPDIDRLAKRLIARIDPGICWQRFSSDSGSQLITQVIDIFEDAVTLGGDPEDVSTRCSAFTSRTAQLRAKRKMVSGTFFWLTAVMHVTMSALLTMVLQIILKFKGLVEAAIDPKQVSAAMQMMDVPLLTFDTQQVMLLRLMTTGIIVVLVIVNAVALLAADGGFKPKICLYLSIFLAASAASFAIAPRLVSAVL